MKDENRAIDNQHPVIMDIFLFTLAGLFLLGFIAIVLVFWFEWWWKLLIVTIASGVMVDIIFSGWKQAVLQKN